MAKQLRNIAIIAHIDHGKTTLVDKLLQQTNTSEKPPEHDRVMDSNELEQERGITITAKNTAIEWDGYHINIVDTPGHADFGGEVERVLSMVDSVLLLVDAVDGPMPQTRFVTQKAFAHGLKPILVVNKVDRPNARCDWVIDQVFELFDNLGASDEQLDFPVVYASALQGYAGLTSDVTSGDMQPLLTTIIEQVAPPAVDEDGPLQMQISSLDYSTYVGAIGIGRISRGKIRANQNVSICHSDGTIKKGRIMQVLGYMGLERQEVTEAYAGDIVAISGIEGLRISETLCDPDHPEPLPALTVDEPTVSMTFQVNTSPFAGRDGDYLTSRKLQARLDQELIYNVALRVDQTENADKFRVSGRGELHLSILLETIRREGSELAVSRPEVIIKEIDGKLCEPFEELTVDIDETHQGKVMEQLSNRKGRLQNMHNDGKGRLRIDYIIPTRGLIGFHTEFLTLTSGTGIMHHVFDHYGPKQQVMNSRINGVLIANVQGTATEYALWNLEQRGRLLIGPQTDVYEGMVVGIHSRDNDLVVNVVRTKQLNNIRAAGNDENIVLTPPIKHSLEQALEFITDDELVEITPKHIRIRKKLLKEQERRTASRAATK